MAYLLDLRVHTDSGAVDSRYHLWVSLPGPLFERWCAINLPKVKVAGSLLSVDLYPDGCVRPKDLKREFLRWFLGKLRREYGGDVVSIRKPSGW